MAMSAADMADKIITNTAAVSTDQQEGIGTASTTYRRNMLIAMCQGIIDEIIESAVIATTSGAPDSEHIGNVTS